MSENVKQNQTENKVPVQRLKRELKYQGTILKIYEVTVYVLESIIPDSSQ